MINYKAIPILILSTLLTSCMTMSKRDCLSGEWQSAGLEDATRGFTDSRFNAHAKACTKHGVSADKALYDQGYSQGLQRYCTLDNGMQLGTNSKEYQGICPAETEKVFLRGYLAGLEDNLDAIDRRYFKLSSALSIERSRQLRSESAEDLQVFDQRIRKLEAALVELRNERNQVTSAIAKWLNPAVR